MSKFISMFVPFSFHWQKTISFFGFDEFIPIMAWEKAHFEVWSHILEVLDEKIKIGSNFNHYGKFSHFLSRLSWLMMKNVRKCRKIGQKAYIFSLEKSGLSSQRQSNGQNYFIWASIMLVYLSQSYFNDNLT